MQDVVALVHQYVPPDPAKIQAAAQAGKAAPERSAEGVLARLRPGAKKIRSYNVASYLEKPEDAVTLAVSF